MAITIKDIIGELKKQVANDNLNTFDVMRSAVSDKAGKSVSDKLEVLTNINISGFEETIKSLTVLNNNFSSYLRDLRRQRAKDEENRRELNETLAKLAGGGAAGNVATGSSSNKEDSSGSGWLKGLLGGAAALAGGKALKVLRNVSPGGPKGSPAETGRSDQRSDKSKKKTSTPDTSKSRSRWRSRGKAGAAILGIGALYSWLSGSGNDTATPGVPPIATAPRPSTPATPKVPPPSAASNMLPAANDNTAGNKPGSKPGKLNSKGQGALDNFKKFLGRNKIPGAGAIVNTMLTVPAVVDILNGDGDWKDKIKQIIPMVSSLIAGHLTGAAAAGVLTAATGGVGVVASGLAYAGGSVVGGLAGEAAGEWLVGLIDDDGKRTMPEKARPRPTAEQFKHQGGLAPKPDVLKQRQEAWDKLFKGKYDPVTGEKLPDAQAQSGIGAAPGSPDGVSSALPRSAVVTDHLENLKKEEKKRKLDSIKEELKAKEQESRFMGREQIDVRPEDLPAGSDQTKINLRKRLQENWDKKYSSISQYYDSETGKRKTPEQILKEREARAVQETGEPASMTPMVPSGKADGKIPSGQQIESTQKRQADAFERMAGKTSDTATKLETNAPSSNTAPIIIDRSDNSTNNNVSTSGGRGGTGAVNKTPIPPRDPNVYEVWT